MSVLMPYERDLKSLDDRHRRRMLAAREGIDFASNDYLGLAAGPALRAIAQAALARGVPVGSGGSRLLRGNHPEHEALEAEAAAWFGAESALFFSTGYAANAALLAALPRPDDLIVHDALIHASTHEGLRLTRAAKAAFAHNDADMAEDAIRTWRAGGGAGVPWIVVESLYSMDGDLAPLAALAAVADRHHGFLVVDEAHATGVFGKRGTGLAEALEGKVNVLTLHTFGKALGCEGAVVAMPAVLRDVMVSRARAFIFSTAPSPLMAAVARGAIELMRDPGRRDRLAVLVAYATTRLARRGGINGGSHIMPLVLGEDFRAMAVAAALQARGFDVRGIRPPTVPTGTARLRISITLNVDEATIDALDAALGDVL